MAKTPIKLLDCTLRDGGYYNNWDFATDLVDIYLKAMDEASVDIVEIGFRSAPKRSFKGPFIYSLDEYLETLSLPAKAQIGVMINASEYLEASDKPEELICKLFQPAECSPVDLVRIAIDFEKTLEAKVLAAMLKELGYQVGLNMMQSQGRDKEQYEQIAGCIAEWGNVDVLYFADSLGNMDPKQVSFICASLKSEWEGPIGIHAHDNKGLALVNSLTALESGVEWCDSTLMGMGRGAGNVNTEAMLMECASRGLHLGNAQSLGRCSERFATLKQEHQWGPNPHYHYAANQNIHPTYVQSILNDSRYEPDYVGAILKSLSQKISTSFSEKALRNAVYSQETHKSEGTWDATGWLKDRKVLMIGAGPSTFKYRHAIINYIKKHKPAVLFLNVNDHLPPELGDATVVAHEGRALFDAKRYHQLGHPIIMPSTSLSKELGSEIEGLEILNYGLTLEDGAYDIGAKGTVLQWPLALAYGLSVATQASAKEIQMVGFDGYDSSDPRQEEMNEVLSAYLGLQNCLPLKSLTPTNYPIPQGSIFEPMIQLNDFVLVIPARYQSGRFPGKPLADLCGKSLIRHVWEKCVQAVGEGPVLVATDDERIQKHCLEQGMQVVMTSPDCLTGTDRICEVANQLDREIYLNVQGDEPLIEPEDILTVLESARRYRNTIINGMCPIKEEQDFRSPNVPKVVAAADGRLLYMSRAPIPTGKNHEFREAMRQVCIYAFPHQAIMEFGRRTKKTPIEDIEDIEILRFLEMGQSVRMVKVKGSTVAVDTQEDLERARKTIDNSNS